MNLFKRIFLLLSTLILACHFLLAQVSGYKGKKYILKTDIFSPVLDRGYRLELEAILFRDLSISVDYLKSSKMDSFDEYLDDYKASFGTNSVGLKIRSYLNKAIPAPLGVYSFLTARKGKTKIDASFNKEIEIEVGQGQVLRREFYSLDNIQFLQFGIGWGYQTIIKDRISFDTGWTLVFSETRLNEYERIIDAKDHGHNLFSLSKPLESYYYNWGISVHLSLGLLLF